MKMLQKLVLGTTIVAVALGAVALTAGPQAARPDGTSKRVVIACKPGWRGGAGGTYGGVPFDVSCDNGRAHVTLDGTVGTAYSVRMGVESSSTGADCFFSGDSPTVSETCVEVRLTIR
jgi:hypothetical protein